MKNYKKINNSSMKSVNGGDNNLLWTAIGEFIGYTGRVAVKMGPNIIFPRFR